MSVPFITSFDNAHQAVESSIANGFAVYSTMENGSDIQSRFDGWETQGIIGGLTIDAAKIILPSLSEILEVIDESGKPHPCSADVTYSNIGNVLIWGRYFNHRNEGFRLVVPISHGSEFSKSKAKSEKVNPRAICKPGDILVIHQSDNDNSPPTYSELAIELPQDTTFSAKKVAINIL